MHAGTGTLPARGTPPSTQYNEGIRRQPGFLPTQSGQGRSPQQALGGSAIPDLRKQQTRMPQPSRFFPPPELADPDGLIAVGGCLEPDWLLDAYRHGIFPWPVTGETTVLAWWSLDPRAVIPLDTFHVPRRLERTCEAGRFEVTCDRDFQGVIRGCATVDGRMGQTWITPGLLRAYVRLFELGHAHSVEVWHEGVLAGGTYGVAIGGLFAAESMFHRVRDASKVALVHLLHHVRARGYELFDIQQLTTATAQFGAVEIPRSEYLARLRKATSKRIRFGKRLVWSPENEGLKDAT